MTSPGRLLRSDEVELFGSSASLTLREAPDDPGSADRPPSSGILSAGLVLSSPGAPPFSLWACFPGGPAMENEVAVPFHVGGLCLHGSLSFVLPWHWSVMASRSHGQSWDRMPAWAALGAVGLGHPENAAIAASALLAGVVLASASDVLAASLVRRACSMVTPERVAELARAAAVEQVMEG